MLKLKYMAGFSFEIGGGHTPPPRSHVILLRFSLVDFGFDVYALWEKKRPESLLVFYFIFLILFGFWIMILEQAALTHDIERIFRSKKTFQNDEGAKQHMAPSTSQAAWTFATV
jgi:hypothetical protein